MKLSQVIAPWQQARIRITPLTHSSHRDWPLSSFRHWSSPHCGNKLHLCMARARRDNARGRGAGSKCMHCYCYACIIMQTHVTRALHTQRTSRCTAPGATHRQVRGTGAVGVGVSCSFGGRTPCPAQADRGMWQDISAHNASHASALT
jgi:hypothetical protein